MNTYAITELEGLLAQALESVTIQYGQSLQLSPTQFKGLLHECRAAYLPHERSKVAASQIEVTRPEVKQKVLEIMNRELADHIRDGNVLSATIAIAGGSRTGGSPVEYILRNLLLRLIADGPGEAAQAFADCTTRTSCKFHRFFLLSGVTVPHPVEIFEGITLEPLPDSVYELPHHVPSLRTESDRFRSVSIKDVLGKTVLRVEYEASPIFHKPAQNYTFQFMPQEHFTIKLKGQEIPDLNLDKLCQALSVVGRRNVRAVLIWTSLLDYEIFDLTSRLNIGGIGYSGEISHLPSSEPVQLKPPQCPAIKTIYKGLTELQTGTWQKLRISIDRWAKSMAEEDTIDQIIDLGIALECLYVPNGRSEVRYRLAHHAAWHLGKDKEHRQQLSKELRQIYDARSVAVHTGVLGEKTRKSMPNGESEFVRRAQELCWLGLSKVIDAGEFPDWKNLIMGDDPN